jgi:hypothetical protein
VSEYSIDFTGAVTAGTTKYDATPPTGTTAERLLLPISKNFGVLSRQTETAAVQEIRSMIDNYLQRIQQMIELGL